MCSGESLQAPFLEEQGVLSLQSKEARKVEGVDPNVVWKFLNES